MHQSQRKQRMGWRPIWGSKVTWANMPLLKNNILPPANKITKLEQSAPPRPYSSGRHAMQRCVCTLFKAVNNEVLSSSKENTREESHCQPVGCQDLCIPSLLRG